MDEKDQRIADLERQLAEERAKLKQYREQAFARELHELMEKHGCTLTPQTQLGIAAKE